ncbi:MAG: hypothetical protein IV090_03195 [Candidatus Sericytochromatia bacterium]|nr:hypothetical protein [Candidatus Sericytochromatia bacterium]
MKKSLLKELLTLSLAGLVLGLSGCGPTGPRDYKQYLQEVNQIQWSPDGKFLVLDYMYGKKINNNIYGDHLLYTFDFSLNKIKLISESQYYCGLFSDKQYVLSTKNVKDSELFFYLFNTTGSNEKIDTPNPSCPMYLNEQFFILFKDINKQNKLIRLNRSNQEKIAIEPDESVQKFIQDENIPEYKIEQIFERNGVLRLILSGSVGYTPEKPHPPKTYATALLQDNKITQIEKLISLEKPFGIRMVFWGISPDNKLIFGKETGSPPLEYFEYDYVKHQRNPRPDLDKINAYLTDGRILDPDAFSPDFSQFVTVQGIAEDAERNTIHELALYDVATGKRKTLFNIYNTLPKGDYKTVVR